MKVYIRLILLALSTASVTVVAHAQHGAASKTDINRCSEWLKVMVPESARVDAVAFCRGLKAEGSPNEWFSIYHCGPAAKPDAEGKKPYCTSSGSLSSDWTIAAGFSAEPDHGAELFPSAETGNAGEPATLYSRTPVHIGGLRIPAGMYRLTISHQADEWKMTVTPEGGQAIGTVPLKATGHQVSSANEDSVIQVHHSGNRCARPSNTGELIFSYNGVELVACLQPEPIEPVQDSAAAR
jgi:hypothetical protein